MKHHQHKLLNGKQLAVRLGVPEVFVTAMKSSGFVFAYGGRTLVPDALAWLKERPNWRYTDYIEAHRKRPKKPLPPRPPRKRPLA
jgi:hypothetical protein